ncbi:hypothetical protein [Ruminococcus sp.]|uniref:hypothetical protein n=1 Tax=Ruminococcus sp. TaxID=41978 RepID=UPI0025E8515A|nr:hypothetical protein [Ruminococcus sp.]
MVYSSLLFIYGFLPVSILLFYLTPKKLRELTLLILSLVFCGMISLYFLIFILAYTAVNYGFSHIICRLRKNEKIAAVPLASGIIIDIAALIIFRTEYFSQLQEFLRAPKGFFPVGISFFSLAAVGTLIDVYKGRLAAEKNIIRFSLYFMFFPRLIMGPLLRYGVFRRILDNRRETAENIGIGMTLFVKGLAKKVIVADDLYMLYTAVRSQNVTELSAVTAWLGIIGFVLCLYFNLSGFADMGTGIAYCFGYRMPQSFNYPLVSTKIKYFAARRQSQVIQWIRRYVTKPLYGVCSHRWIKELIFIFGWILFGIWYTFSVNGALWGLLIGTAVVIESRIAKRKGMDITGMIYTAFLIIICSVFLAGSSPSYSGRYLLAMICGNGVIADSQAFYLLKSYIVLILAAIYAASDLFRNLMIRTGKKKVKNVITAASTLVVLAALIFCTALMSYNGSSEMLIMKL